MPPVSASDLVDSMRDGLVVLDPDHTVRFANPAFRTLFSLTETEILGRRIGAVLADRITEATLSRGLAETLDPHGRGSVDLDMSGPAPAHWIVRIHARHVRDPDGGSAKILLAFEDVTGPVEHARVAERHQRLLQGIVDTVRESLLVMDGELRVISASRSFYRTFGVTQAETVGHRLPDLGDGQWDIAALRHLLEKIIPEHATVEDFEVEHEFPGIGRRVMLLNARKIFREGNTTKTFLLAIEDVTDRRRVEAERDAALQRVEALLEELNHRVMNSLSIISAVIGMEGRSLSDEAARVAFERVAARVMAVANLYKALSKARSYDVVDASAFFGGIGTEVVAALQSGRTPLRLHTEIEPFPLSSREAIAAGLVLNELLTNAIKYAFAARDDGEIRLSVRKVAGEVTMRVADNGSGVDENARVDSGIGGKLIDMFSRQLGGRTVRHSTESGTVACLTFPLPPGPAPEAGV